MTLMETYLLIDWLICWQHSVTSITGKELRMMISFSLTYDGWSADPHKTAEFAILLAIPLHGRLIGSGYCRFQTEKKWIQRTRRVTDALKQILDRLHITTWSIMSVPSACSAWSGSYRAPCCTYVAPEKGQQGSAISHHNPIQTTNWSYRNGWKVDKELVWTDRTKGARYGKEVTRRKNWYEWGKEHW